ANEERAAEVLVKQQGVLADPPQPRAPGKVALQKRGGIDDRTSSASWNLFLRPFKQFIEASPEDLVIVIAASGITSDKGRRAGDESPRSLTLRVGRLARSPDSESQATGGRV